MTKDYNIFYNFVVNKNDSIITQWNDGYYVLLEDNLKEYKDYNIELNTLSLNSLKPLMWRDLWINKSDYIEYYYLNIVGKYR